MTGSILTGNLTNTGNLSITNSIGIGSGSLSDGGTINNQGTITQNTDASVPTSNPTLSFGTINNQSGGNYNFQSGVIRSTSTVNDSFNNSGILLKTTNGTATGNVTNAGTIDPGFSAGQINLTGNYTSTNTAEIKIELGGITKGSGYDFFDISGSANLNGTLAAILILKTRSENFA